MNQERSSMPASPEKNYLGHNHHRIASNFEGANIVNRKAEEWRNERNNAEIIEFNRISPRISPKKIYINNQVFEPQAKPFGVHHRTITTNIIETMNGTNLNGHYL